MSELSDHLAKGAKAALTKRPPAWKGPEKDGITFSLLSRFLECRERFRILTIEGLQENEGFSHRLEYGNMWHACEEALAAKKPWEPALASYSQGLLSAFPLSADQIVHWTDVCAVQFPIYVDWWSKHPDVKNRTPLEQEKVFAIAYKLPSGRIVTLKGKRDSVDDIREAKVSGVYLQENKTKADIDEEQLFKELSSGFELQTMLYLTALHAEQKFKNVAGVRYNVVRRPLSGGKGSIVRHKATKGAQCPKCKGGGCLKCGSRGRIGGKPEETKESYLKRLKGIIDGSGEDAPGPAYFFMRWRSEVSIKDVLRFQKETLDPILEQLVDWWDWVSNCWKISRNPFDQNGRSIHWRHPFGVRNSINQGYGSIMDEYLRSGDKRGLRQVTNLFPELK